MQPSGRELSPRERLILHAVVREYIETGEPVGSRTVSRLRHLALSPASIRNVMAELADEGYLAQPHTSAGRIPTEHAFRDFAASIPQRSSIAALDQERIVAQLQAADSLEGRVEVASRMVTELTRNVGIAAALPATSQALEHIELIGLSDRRVLMIVATRDRMVRHRVVAIDRELSQDLLTQLRNYVNTHFSGWMLDRARAELLRRIEAEREMYDAVLQHLNVLFQKGLMQIDSDPQLSMDGASYLVGLDLHLTRERLRELFRTLEEKKQVVALLDRFLESAPGGGVGIHIGLGEAHPAMGALTLVGLTVAMPSGARTRIAVLGPMRMHYEKAISAVVQIGRAFEELHA